MLDCIRLLDLAITFDGLASIESKQQALDDVRRLERFSKHERLLNELSAAACKQLKSSNKLIAELSENMLLAEDVFTENGMLMVSEGQLLTESLIALLRNYDSNQGIVQPIRVHI